MNLFITAIIATTLCRQSAGNQRQTKGVITDDDYRVLSEAIEKFGPFQDYKTLNLPGPELLTDKNKLSLTNFLVGNATTGNYTLRFRTITENFSYNSRFEVGEIKKNGSREIPVIRGQFADHLQREDGGFYIRSIGYTLDEKGYRQFLVDLSAAVTSIEDFDISHFQGGGTGGNVPGAPSIGKVTISSTVLITLTGGNLG